ncbi:alkanesulfonate monooxygenase SsuD/methylene tetrahydromethanopterin reductase-like flavin-dependent oxidoreductase (luciferase family) [Jatrophihabitans sp. GAS493]|uniref:LLM class flavin-dependent oxidoreductase n=1 Tax=Jatrophihabitans sp. GAS493 TaxID=1907575 RepID=UPI000BB8C113|nr:LLM class flavin-dependent oxidoreductase [Jatrophihabitans sp. GAS493]SOD71760.1 alkanesulfonate monooxygenase SsuD/methylene tetrahydromethanopterin reductase-like flavin-dependent oxidoreductase (luciferase family) [Jatrophihabitans sp. GAS493]
MTVSDTGARGVLVGSWPLGMPAGPEHFYADLAAAVETGGFDSLFVGDHLFAAGPGPDSLALLAYFAARTSRLKIGTSVLQLALREPVAAAKQIATIDALSGGRLLLGVGVGGEFADEWSAAGVPTAGRGRRLDEWLELASQLWSGQPVDHQGPLRTVAGVVGSPAPHRSGGPPIWVGGRSEAALQRAARHDGWIAYASSLRRIRASVETLAELRAGGASASGSGGLDGYPISLVLWTYIGASRAQARRGVAEVLGARYRQDFDQFVDSFCAVGEAAEVQDRIAAFREAGVTNILFNPQCPAGEFLEQVQRLSELETAPCPVR